MNARNLDIAQVDRSELASLLEEHAGAKLLAALGLPVHDPAQPALTALHAGAAFHRLAVLRDVTESYRTQAGLSDAEMPVLRLLDDSVGQTSPRAVTERFYRIALAWDDRLAEAWYGLGRLHQYRNEREAALDAFARAGSLEPHPRASGNAHLHANAHFSRACLLEDMERDEEALAAYRQALALLDNFGVHHQRIADFLRRHGSSAETVRAYEKLMAYGHRYFPEFTLPPLEAVTPPAAVERLEVLYETSDGAPVVFWQGGYYRIAPALMPITAKTLAGLGRRPPSTLTRLLSLVGGFLGAIPRSPPDSASVAEPGIRKADNMIALEPAGGTPGDVDSTRRRQPLQ